jgi:hypothetical protein
MGIEVPGSLDWTGLGVCIFDMDSGKVGVFEILLLGQSRTTVENVAKSNGRTSQYYRCYEKEDQMEHINIEWEVCYQYFRIEKQCGVLRAMLNSL